MFLLHLPFIKNDSDDIKLMKLRLIFTRKIKKRKMKINKILDIYYSICSKRVITSLKVDSKMFFSEVLLS
jgi:hypothetical protein